MKQSYEVKVFLKEHFGMFIHWGLYSVPAGVWKDRIQEQDDPGEGIMGKFRIPINEYKELIKQFNPLPESAEALVIAAQKTGMRYIVITSKHHDGFCLFRTGVNSYNTYDTIGRDLIREFAAACRKHGIRLGLYYSHTLDLSEKHALGTVQANGNIMDNGNTWDFPDESEKDFTKYLYGKCFPQVRELLTQYGDVFLMWFDFPHNITPGQCSELYDFVKSIQPKCLVNSRIGNIPADYFDLGDNQIPTVPMGVPLECLVTLNDTWGFKLHDHNWKAPEQIIDMLTRSASCGANLLVNVGPESDGSIPPETVKILDTLSQWISENREAVYETSCSPFKAVFDWGHVSQKENNIYLYMNDSAKRIIEINGLLSDVEKVVQISNGNEAGHRQTDDLQGYRKLTVNIPEVKSKLPVYRISCKSEVIIDKRLFQNGRTLNLYPLWAQKYRYERGADTAAEMRVENNVHDSDNGKCGLAVDRGGITSGWKSSEEYLSWEAVFTRKGKHEVQLFTVPGEHMANGRCGVSISVEDQNGCMQSISIDLLNRDSQYQVSKTGQQNVRIGSVCGEICIETPGTYKIRLYRSQTGEVKIPVVYLKFTQMEEK